MWERRRRRRESLSVTAEINLINLVDVALVLLIIFMITAPIMQGGVQVQLPRGDVTPITASEGVIISVARDGTIYMGEVPVRSLEEFEGMFPTYMRGRSARIVYLRGDRAVSYGRVVQVFGVMQKLNIAEVALIVEPEQ